MPRAVWSGSISFGLVSVPVKLYSAVRKKDVHFHQVEEETGARIRYQRVSEETGEEVPYEDIVKAYEVSKGENVVVTPDELEAMAPENSHTIEVEDFVALAEIDPLYFDSAYWVASDGSRGASKAHALLVRSMEKAERIGIGRFVMRAKEHLVALRPVEGALALHTMVFPDELVVASSYDGTVATAKVTEKECDAALRLIDSLTVPFEPDRYHDEYREELLGLIDKKASGKRITRRKPEREEAEVLDLMSALEASLGRGKKQAARKPARKRTARKAPARRAQARKRAAKSA